MKKVRIVGNRLITLPFVKIKNSRTYNNIHFCKDTYKQNIRYCLWRGWGTEKQMEGNKIFKITKYMNKREKCVELK